MKKIDIIIGVLVSAGLHGGVLWGGELIGVASHHGPAQAADDQQIVAAEIDFTPEPEEEKPPQEAADQQSDDQNSSDSDLGGDASAASLPEPMNTSASATSRPLSSRPRRSPRKPSPPLGPRRASRPASSTRAGSRSSSTSANSTRSPRLARRSRPVIPSS